MCACARACICVCACALSQPRSALLFCPVFAPSSGPSCYLVRMRFCLYGCGSTRLRAWGPTLSKGVHGVGVWGGGTGGRPRHAKRVYYISLVRLSGIGR